MTQSNEKLKHVSRKATKIKVLHVIPNLEIGGAEIQLVSLASHINRQRFDMAVCCIGDGPLVEQFRSLGVDVFVFYRKPLKLGIRASLEMYKLLQSFRPDIVHCQGFSAGVRGQLLAKLTRVPVLIKSYHGLNNWKKGLYLQLDRSLSWSTDHYVLVSKARRNLLTKRERIPNRKSTVIYNGIDHRRFALNYSADERRRMKATLGLDPHKCCVGTVGSLKPVKNQAMFLEAARLVRDQCPNVQFAVVGGGPLRDELQRRAKALNLENDFHLLGVRNDIPEVLQAFDIFTMQSVSEDLSVAILEAMSSSLPVIATEVGGNGELVVNGQTGFLVPSKDAVAMSRSILSLAKDEELRSMMGISACDRVKQHFSAETNARNTEDLYDKCLRNKAIQRDRSWVPFQRAI